MKTQFMFDDYDTQVLERENDVVTIIDTETESIRSDSGQCGETCPNNDANHRGKCYLDFGHSSSHKCSVDGHTW